MTAYYNENDENAALWLERLIDFGAIAPGHVDRRSIRDVRPGDLRGYSQCHFFAGIGGWSLAARLAGWGDDAPLWTGSCPCQPFSDAGRQAGFEDERHLWPVLADLARECRPAIIVGEQVASKLGRAWLGTVFADLEGMGYSVAGADLCGASVGAPHIRQRLYWGGVRSADPARDGRGELRRLEHAPGNGREQRRPRSSGRGVVGGRGEGFWSGCEWIECSDGKARPIEPGSFPLANGVPGRVGLLRGYGNAIVPQVAAVFLESLAESVAELRGLS